MRKESGSDCLAISTFCRLMCRYCRSSWYGLGGTSSASEYTTGSFGASAAASPPVGLLPRSSFTLEGGTGEEASDCVPGKTQIGLPVRISKSVEGMFTAVEARGHHCNLSRTHTPGDLDKMSVLYIPCTFLSCPQQRSPSRPAGRDEDSQLPLCQPQLETHQSQFTASERQVCPFATQSSDALLKVWDDVVSLNSLHSGYKTGNLPTELMFSSLY